MNFPVVTNSLTPLQSERFFSEGNPSTKLEAHRRENGVQIIVHYMERRPDFSGMSDPKMLVCWISKSDVPRLASVLAPSVGVSGTWRDDPNVLDAHRALMERLAVCGSNHGDSNAVHECLDALCGAVAGSAATDPLDQPTPESGATDFKAHVIEVLGDAMGELRIARDSSQGSMVEQIANELRRLHTENAGIWKARDSLLSENARLQASGSTGAPDAWAGLDAQAVAELESFREHLEHHKEASPARVCRFCEEKWPNSTAVKPAGSTGGAPTRENVTIETGEIPWSANHDRLLRELVEAVYRHCEREEGFDPRGAMWGIPYHLIDSFFPSSAAASRVPSESPPAPNRSKKP